MSEFVINTLKQEIKDLEAMLARRQKALVALNGGTQAPKAKVSAKGPVAPKRAENLVRYSNDAVESVLNFMEGAATNKLSATEIEKGSGSKGRLTAVLSKLEKQGHIEGFGAKRGKRYRFVSWPEHLAKSAE